MKISFHSHFVPSKWLQMPWILRFEWCVHSISIQICVYENCVCWFPAIHTHSPLIHFRSTEHNFILSKHTHAAHTQYSFLFIASFTSLDDGWHWLVSHSPASRLCFVYLHLSISFFLAMRSRCGSLNGGRDSCCCVFVCDFLLSFFTLNKNRHCAFDRCNEPNTYALAHTHSLSHSVSQSQTPTDWKSKIMRKMREMFRNNSRAIYISFYEFYFICWITVHSSHKHETRTLLLSADNVFLLFVYSMVRRRRLLLLLLLLAITTSVVVHKSQRKCSVRARKREQRQA